MNFFTSLTVAFQSSEGGLTLHEIIADLPTDPASVAVLILLGASVALVVWTGRPKGGGGRKA